MDTIQARLYPNELMTCFNLELNNWVLNKSEKYFLERDPESKIAIREVMNEIKLIDRS